MLHLIISTPRSGSNSLCRYLNRNIAGSKNLFEVITDFTFNNSTSTKNTEDVIQLLKNLMKRSSNEDLIVKCHVEQLLSFYPQHVDFLDNFLKTAKLYYCLRLNLSQQIKSICGIQSTGICDRRTEKNNIFITGQNAFYMCSKTILQVGIQGELYKHYPGDLMILEEMTNKYAENDLTLSSVKYDDTYSFTYDSIYTQKFVEQQVDVLAIFNNGNSLYTIFGD